MIDIVIGFSKPKSRFALFGHLIRFYTGADFSHCYVRFISSQLISQASDGMVNLTHQEVFTTDNVIVEEIRIPVSNSQFEQIMGYVIKNAGRPYSYLQIVGIIVADLLGLNRNPLDMNKKTFVCSEYLGQILRILGITANKHLSLLTPVDIYNMVKK